MKDKTILKMYTINGIFLNINNIYFLKLVQISSIIFYLSLKTLHFHQQMKVVLSNSGYLITLYPLTDIQNIIINCVGESADIFPSLLFLNIAFNQLSTVCQSVRK